MTSERVEAIRERLAKATPGPWDVHSSTIRGVQYRKDGTYWRRCSIARILGGANYVPEAPNAELIAHAPTDLAWACDEIERLTQQVEEMREVVEAASQAVSAQKNLRDLSGPVHRIALALSRLSPKEGEK